MLLFYVYCLLRVPEIYFTEGLLVDESLVLGHLYITMRHKVVACF